MNYIQATFTIEPFQDYIADVLSEELGECGFESFVVNDGKLEALARSIHYHFDICRRPQAEYICVAFRIRIPKVGSACCFQPYPILYALCNSEVFSV